MIPSRPPRWQTKYALVGGLVLLPALTLAGSGLLQGVFGIDLTDQLPARLRSLVFGPAVLLGGLCGVLLVGVTDVLALRWDRAAGAFSCTLHVRGRWAPVGLVVLSSTLLAAILAYAFCENFRVVPR